MSGGKKKQGQMGQKHQNKTAFKIQFNPLALQIHKKVSFRGLCKRCAGQVQWKIQYNKYKRMTEPSRCALCLQKTVLRTYMTACEPCSESLRICPKCLDAESEEQVEVRLTEKEQKRMDEESERKMNEFLKTLKERSRRRVKRLYEKFTIKWDKEINNFVDEEGNTLPLQFRHGYGTNVGKEDENDEDIDEFGDEEDEEGEEEAEAEQAEEGSKKKAKPKGKKVESDKQGKEEDQEHDEEENEQDDEENQDEDEDEEAEQKEKVKQGETAQEGSAPQNDEDWQDVDQQEQEQGEDQEQSSNDQKKKKRKHSGHKHSHGCHHK